MNPITHIFYRNHGESPSTCVSFDEPNNQDRHTTRHIARCSSCVIMSTEFDFYTNCFNSTRSPLTQNATELYVLDDGVRSAHKCASRLAKRSSSLQGNVLRAAELLHLFLLLQHARPSAIVHRCPATGTGLLQYHHTLLVISINSVAKPEAIERSLHFHVTHVTVVLIENDWNLINHRNDIGYFKFRRGFVTNLRVRLLHRKFEFSTIQYSFILLLYI